MSERTEPADPHAPADPRGGDPRQGDVRPTDAPASAPWFALLGGPGAWTAHLLGSYPLVPLACRMGTTTPVNILTAVTAAVALTAAATGWWAYRRHGAGGGPAGGPAGGSAGGGGGSADAADAGDSAGFMGLAGMLLALLFTFAILLEGLPALLQDPCVEGL